MTASAALLSTSKPTLVDLDELSRGGGINARTRAKGVDDLKSSIASIGLILPLSVRKVGKVYEVIDGNRRLEALTQLHHEGVEIGKIPVLIRKDKDAEAHEASLAANLIRMPLDEFEACEAFVRMAASGIPKEKIARTFNIPVKIVQQRLALGNLHPRAKQLIEHGEMEIEAAEKLAPLSHEEQARVLDKAAETGHYAKWLIGRLCDDTRIEADSNLAEFVGADTYAKAGGETITDLFGEGTYWHNSTLALELAERKVKALTTELLADGWAWVKRGEEMQNYRSKLNKRPPDLISYPSPELEQELQAAQARLDELYDMEDVEDEDEETRLSRRIAEIQRMAVENYSDEAKRSSGVIVDLSSINIITYGWYDPATARQQAAAQEAAPAPAKKEEQGYSVALLNDLAQELTAGMALEIMKKPGLAYDLAITSLFLSLAGFRDAFNINASAHHYGTEDQGGAQEVFAAIRDRTLQPYRQQKFADVFDMVRQMTPAEKENTLCLCMAASLSPMKRGHVLEAHIWPDVRQHWKPDAAFLSRLSKPQIIEALKEIGTDKDRLTALAGYKKAALVAYAEPLLCASDWRPAYMRLI